MSPPPANCGASKYLSPGSKSRGFPPTPYLWHTPVKGVEFCMSDRYLTVAAMLDDPDTMLCVLREMRRRFGEWPAAAMLYATPWREVTRTPRGVKTVHHALSRLPGVNTAAGTGQVLARVEQEDEGGWSLFTSEGAFGPFDTADEAKREAERLLLEGGEVAHLLTEMPWTTEDDMEWPMPAPPSEAPYR